MTICHDVPVLPALIHPSHDMTWKPWGLYGSCGQCLAYSCTAHPDEAEDEALAAECPGRGWWDGPERWGQRPDFEDRMPCRSR